ncbi:MAG: hemerythrin family protein [Desulfovibrionaceae bacterium]|nr:hemerythrin family protein [Desulfovibrionaceae bacterium]
MIIITKDMETGVVKIDKQHIELIRRINDVVLIGTKSVSKEEMQKTIDFLDEYIVEHFKDEEELQIQCNYNKYGSHKEKHQSFISYFQKMKGEFSANGPSAVFTADLNNYVINWIVSHIKNTDVEFGRFYNKKNQQE